MLIKLELFGKAICLLFLFALSCQDIRWKRMDAKLLYTFLMAGLVCFLLEFILNIEESRFVEVGMLRSGEADIVAIDRFGKNFFPRIIPGVLFLSVGILTNERIGYGDGLTVVAMGFLMEPFLLWKVLGISMVLATVYGSLRLFGKKQKQNGTDMECAVPYLPFLLTGMVVMLCVI